MTPVVLSGGSGTRLWPVSRRSFPKQFNHLLDESLLRKTLQRLTPLGSPWVVAVADSRVLTSQTLAELDLPPEQAIFEPAGRNTAPAVALLCHLFRLRGRGGEVVGIFPADHLITDEERFRDTLGLAETCARRGRVVTLGIRPTEPSTGYGYIEVTDEVFADDEPRGLIAHGTRGFREKPDLETARSFVEAGRFFWNSGMFVFSVEVMAGHFERLMPDLWRGISEIEGDLSNLGEIYTDLPAKSLDFGIMEHLDDQVSIPCDLGWSDLGSWDEVAQVVENGAGIVEHDAAGNFVFPHRDKTYAFTGVEDLIVVDTADATLITRKGASQGVKGMVDKLREAGDPRATEHVFEHRPWGNFEILRDTEDFKSKIIRVAPGQRLSYQSHRHRSEHWVIVKGHPEIVLDSEILTPAPGEAVYIPRGAKHRIRNPTDEVVELVEVQLGTYFGEDDIIRYEDDYQRV